MTPLPQQTPSTHQSRWQFLPIKQLLSTIQQWSSAEHCTYHQTRHVFSNRGQASYIVHSSTRSSVHPHHTGGDGTQVATNTTINWQLNGRWCSQWKSSTKVNKKHGHAVSLVPRQRISGAVQNLLGTRKTELCWLLDKAPPSKAPQKCKKIMFNTTCGIRDAEDRAGESGSSNSSMHDGKCVWGCDDPRLRSSSACVLP